MVKRKSKLKPNCIYCNAPLTISNRVMDDGRGNKTNICTECHLKSSRERTAKWRKRNPEKNKEVWQNGNKIASDKYIKMKKEYIEKIGGCQICGYNDFSCLPVFEFHHMSGDKDLNVSSYRRTIRKNTFLKEIQKCIVVCANCHRKIHYNSGIITALSH